LGTPLTYFKYCVKQCDTALSMHDVIKSTNLLDMSFTT